MARLDLPNKNGFKFNFDSDKIMSLSDEVEEFIESEPSLKKVIFKSQIPKDIQSNNIIEGIDNNIEDIRTIIGRKLVFDLTGDKTSKEKKILNLYKAYKYIQQRKDINKDNLRYLYKLISDGLIDPVDNRFMGEYYREDEVRITNLPFYDDRITGVNYKDVSDYVDKLIEYIHTARPNNYTDTFVISQIVHFYFVFIHPYFDCNGRTSRTVSMWYLLNNKAEAFLNFNRSIPFAKSKYNKAINMSRDTSDITHFVKYMLEIEKLQLEKEYVIGTMEKKRGKNYTDDEYLLLEYFLSNNEPVNLLSLTSKFNSISKRRIKTGEVKSKLEPFMETGQIIQIGTTNKKLSNGEGNPVLRINGDMFDFDKSKIKRLILPNYVNK